MLFAFLLSNFGLFLYSMLEDSMIDWKAIDGIELLD
jgi:hypothetical protein